VKEEMIREGRRTAIPTQEKNEKKEPTSGQIQEGLGREPSERPPKGNLMREEPFITSSTTNHRSDRNANVTEEWSPKKQSM